MKRLIVILFACLIARLVRAEDAAQKAIFFSHANNENSVTIGIFNDTGFDVSNIKVHSDCGCLSIQGWTKVLKKGEMGEIHCLLKAYRTEQRLSKTLYVDGSLGFVKQIEIVNYVYSEKPQVFGDTVIRLEHAADQPIHKTVIIIGDKTLSDLQCSFFESSFIKYDLSPAFPVKNTDGCFKRVLTMRLQPGIMDNEEVRFLTTMITSDNRLVVKLN